jgi:ribonuclease VapC
MFVDASVIVAILTKEADAAALAGRIARVSQVYVSPIVIFEATAGIVHKIACPVEVAEEIVQDFVAECGAMIVTIDAAIGRHAIAAWRRFGKGRHKARLNMGDCFAYACAKAHRQPLHYKGNDFSQTDVRSA